MGQLLEGQRGKIVKGESLVWGVKVSQLNTLLPHVYSCTKRSKPGEYIVVGRFTRDESVLVG